MAKTTRRYYFAARNERTTHGYRINFVNIPQAEASGTTYEETVYYSYRVLAEFLAHLPKDEAALTAYTLNQMPDTEDNNVFYSLVSVTPDFDPHKMVTHFTLPQAPPAEIRRKASKLAQLVAHQSKVASL
ncbi:hypothetical protein [Lacticaseibacillus yichunensis]|uniref:Uncharacterized protein n=1 Tax=Lacticaseibacillus yichunensis TaxID=2486015 RepID=A0ABW4CNP1_9LACO|nr:hypothetical protein [Lacticaseibacillus yichunensis]